MYCLITCGVINVFSLRIHAVKWLYIHDKFIGKIVVKNRNILRNFDEFHFCMNFWFNKKNVAILKTSLAYLCLKSTYFTGTRKVIIFDEPKVETLKSNNLTYFTIINLRHDTNCMSMPLTFFLCVYFGTILFTLLRNKAEVLTLDHVPRTVFNWTYIINN